MNKVRTVTLVAGIAAASVGGLMTLRTPAPLTQDAAKLSMEQAYAAMDELGKGVREYLPLIDCTEPVTIKPCRNVTLYQQMIEQGHKTSEVVKSADQVAHGLIWDQDAATRSVKAAHDSLEQLRTLTASPEYMDTAPDAVKDVADKARPVIAAVSTQ
jgi:hypothetical protein